VKDQPGKSSQNIQPSGGMNAGGTGHPKTTRGEDDGPTEDKEESRKESVGGGLGGWEGNPCLLAFKPADQKCTCLGTKKWKKPELKVLRHSQKKKKKEKKGDHPGRMTPKTVAFGDRFNRRGQTGTGEGEGGRVYVFLEKTGPSPWWKN